MSKFLHHALSASQAGTGSEFLGRVCTRCLLRRRRQCGGGAGHSRPQARARPGQPACLHVGARRQPRQPRQAWRRAPALQQQRQPPRQVHSCCFSVSFGAWQHGLLMNHAGPGTANSHWSLQPTMAPFAHSSTCTCSVTSRHRDEHGREGRDRDGGSCRDEDRDDRRRGDSRSGGDESRHGSVARDGGGRSGGGSSWEAATPRQRGGEDEWEMTPATVCVLPRWSEDTSDLRCQGSCTQASCIRPSRWCGI